MPDLVSFTHQGIHWQVVPAYRDTLFAGGALALEEWLRQGQARIVKQGPHRTVYHVTLPGLSFYLKHYPLADLRSWLRQLVRPAKARTEFAQAVEVAARGVPTFVPLALGERLSLVGTGESYLITRDLEGTQTLQQFLENLASRPRYCHPRLRHDIAVSLGRLLARMHDAGIRHDDLHAGNLLIHVANDGNPALFLIDLHAVHLGDMLSWPARRANLVLLNRFFSLRANRTDRLRFWKAYCQACIHSFMPSRQDAGQRAQFQAAARDVERQTWISNLAFWKKLDARCLGTNRYFRRLRDAQMVGYVVKDLDQDCLHGLLADPDEPFSRPGVVVHKNSRSSTVVEFDVSVGGKTRRVIYKRFRVTAWSDPLAALLRPAPALRSWQYGHALRHRCLPTPRPLLVLHRCRRGLCYEGYLLTEKIADALELHQFLDRLRDYPRGRRLGLVRKGIDQLGRLVRRLHQCHLSHRDLKAANVLVTHPAWATAGETPHPDDLAVWLIDLVGVEQYARLPRARRVQNLTRLHASFVRSAHITRSDKLRFLRVYLQWGLLGKKGWKSWWRAVAQATEAKVAKNLRRGRPLA